MTKGAKIGLAILAATIVLFTAVVVAAGVYLGWEIAEGARLAKAGFEGMQQRDYAGALTHLTDASHRIVFGENRYWLYINLGSCYSQTKDHAEAIKAFTKAIELNPERADAYDWRAAEFRKGHEIDRELADCDKTIQLDPNRALPHSERGQILFDRGEFDRAAADFEEAVRIWPNFSNSYLMLGRSRAKRGEWEAALANLDAYVRMMPSSRIGYEERAKIYREMGETEHAFFDTAEAQYLASQQPFTRPKPGLKSTSGVFGGRDKFSLAPLPTLEGSDPESVLTSYYTVMTEATKAREAGDYDKAMNLLNKALRLNLDSKQASTVMISRADCFWNKGEYDEAARAYDEAIKLAPQSAAAYFFRATNLEWEGDIESALKDFEEAIRLFPNDYRPYAYRGVAFFYNGDFKSALVDFAKSIEISPTQDEAYQFRGRLYMQQGELDKAIADCSSAIEFHPESFYSYGARARVYLRANKCDLAWNDLAKERTLAAHEEIMVHDDGAWFRATCPNAAMRNSQEALREAQRSCEMVHWRHWFSLDVLASAEAEAGNFAKAIEYGQRALEQPIPPVYKPEVEARLDSYRKHQAFREGQLVK